MATTEGQNWLPVIPGSPGSPRGPSSPGGPVAPGGPMILGAGSPLVPCKPGVPGAPGFPGRPGMDCPKKHCINQCVYVRHRERNKTEDGKVTRGERTSESVCICLGGQMAERLGSQAINQKVFGSIPGRAK